MRNPIKLLVFAVMFAGLGGITHAKQVLRVAHDQWIGYSAFFIADAKGFFADEGLEVQASSFSGPGDTIPPLLAGHIDIALTTLYNLALAQAKHQGKVSAIYLLDTSNGADAVVAAKGIRKPADLKGRSVAVTNGEVNHMLLLKALESAGLSERDIKLVNMNADDAGAALLAGRVDAAVTWEPWVTRAKGSGAEVIYTSADAPDLILDSVAVREETRKQKSAELTAFLRAIDKGAAYLREHPAESRAIVARKLDVSEADVNGMLAGDKIYDVADNKRLLAPGGQGYRSAAEVVKFLRAQGLISQPLDENALMTPALLP